jgi:hypothetical protein
MKFQNSIFADGRVPAINKLVAEPLDIVEAYKLVKFIKELKEKETSFLEAKTTIFEKYGKKNKEGNWEIKGEKKVQKAQAELNELLAIEEEYAFDSKIKLPEGIKLSAAELGLLEEIVEVPIK